jgi:putative ABC transport system permease protein
LRWDVFRTPTQARDRIEEVSQDAHAGKGALTYYFDSGTATPLRGIYVADASIPLPAIASTAFLNATGLRVGSQTELVFGDVDLPIVIRGQVDYFPTMDELHSQFLILNQQQYYDFGGLTLQNTGTVPTEAWLTLTTDPARRANALDALQSRFGIGPLDRIDTQALLAEANADPIVRAGGSGVLLIALVAAFAVLALGFALTLYLGGQARSLEISVLRAVGLSSRQVFVMICMEYLLVAAIGLAIGTLAGLRISMTMLDFLNVTADGHRLLPPFALTTRWDTVAVAFAATALAFVVGIAALAVYFLRLPLSRMLRITR